MKTETQKSINELNEQHFFELKNQLESKEQEKIKTVKELELALREANRKIENLNSVNTELEKEKEFFKKEDQDGKAKLKENKKELDIYKEQLDYLRNQNKDLDVCKFTQEKNINEFTIKYEMLNKQMEDRKQTIDNLNLLVSQVQNQKADLEENIKVLKANIVIIEGKFKQSVDEINKGNEIINTLKV